MTLLNPVPYRLKPVHDAWLRACADKQGHGNKAIALRLVLDQAMKAESNRKKRAA